MDVAWIMLAECRIEQIDDRHVETVEPDHGLVARIAMVVIGPRRRQDEIARVHGGALAIDGRVGAAAFDDEPQRGGGMTMATCRFARKNELQPGVQAVGDLRRAAKAGILQHEHPPLRFLRREQPSRFHQQRPHRIVAPERSNHLRRRCRREAQLEHLPQRPHVVRAEAVVELLPFRRQGRLGERKCRRAVHG
jgi:hypothetical protein